MITAEICLVFMGLSFAVGIVIAALAINIITPYRDDNEPGA